MLTRRHIRAKVMQSIYAFVQSGKENVALEQKNMLKNIDNIFDLYVLMLNMLIDVVDFEKNKIENRKHRINIDGGKSESEDSLLANNRYVEKLAQNKALNKYTEDRSLTWRNNDEYISIILKEIKNSDLYKRYLSRDKYTFNSDKNFAVDVFKEIIAPNEKVHEFIEAESIAWLGDMQVANSMAVKTLTYVYEDSTDNESLLSLYKDEEDKDFAKRLFVKTIENSEEYEGIIASKTPEWDKERIASLDLIMMEMAICEFTHFPSIPSKVSINEYLELSKDFSTVKSRVFINGVLDKVYKDLDKKGLIQKKGRGLE